MAVNRLKNFCRQRLGKAALPTALILCAGTLTACGAGAGGPSAVKLTRAGEGVSILESEEDARRCRNLGEVIGPPPYLLPGDGVSRMKNRTGAKGGNALLVTNGVIGIAKGVAYRC